MPCDCLTRIIYIIIYIYIHGIRSCGIRLLFWIVMSRFIKCIEESKIPRLFVCTWYFLRQIAFGQFEGLIQLGDELLRDTTLEAIRLRVPCREMAELHQGRKYMGTTWNKTKTRQSIEGNWEQGKWAVVKLGETCETKSFSWKENLEKVSEVTRNHQALHQTCGTWQASLEVAWSCSNTLSWNTRRMK